MTLNIRCSGWSYEGWKGTFYPKKLQTKDYLSYYSKFFKFVEIDSTYYHIPSRSTVRGWKDKTPVFVVLSPLKMDSLSIFPWK